MKLIQNGFYDEVKAVLVPWNPGDARAPFGGGVYPHDVIAVKEAEMAAKGWTRIDGVRGRKGHGVEILFGRCLVKIMASLEPTGLVLQSDKPEGFKGGHTSAGVPHWENVVHQAWIEY